MAYASRALSFIKEKCNETPGKILKFVKESKDIGLSYSILEDDDPDADIAPDWFFEELQNCSNVEEED